MANLPTRYTTAWRAPFDEKVRQSLQPDMCILDVGAGRKPTVPFSERPSGTYYVGLDLSLTELRKAPTNAYDTLLAADIAVYQPALVNQFDLILSYQVLEHVKSLKATFSNLQAYLRPGGIVITQLSGTFSLFGLLNRGMPTGLGIWIMQHWLGRQPDTVFPAYYDRCYYTALEHLLINWQAKEIIPRYRGATYLNFSSLLQGIYLHYEEWAKQHQNLASHYIIIAKK